MRCRVQRVIMERDRSGLKGVLREMVSQPGVDPAQDGSWTNEEETLAAQLLYPEKMPLGNELGEDPLADVFKIEVR